MIALPFPINKLEWDVLASCRGGLNDFGISKARGKDEYNVKFTVKAPEEG